MHACTITTARYMAHTRVLAESFTAHNPDARFSVLVIDDSPAGGLGERERFQTLTPADVGIDRDELDRRATMYLTQGLAASMKPNLLGALLERGEQAVLYIDADGCIYNDLSGLGELARHHSLVLSPHTHQPHALWKVDSPEQIFMRAGAMNAGLIGVGATDDGRAFVQWWGERAARRCIFDEPHALFLEQTWLTLATTLFDHHVLGDRGCNVAGWNLHTRDVQWEDDVPTIEGGPLRHFHFAMSYDPEQPQLLTPSEAAWWWTPLERRPGAARLSREYAQRLLDSGYREAREAPPLFDKMPGGAPIEPWMRASYRAAVLEAEHDSGEEPPNPFTHGEERFQRWLTPRAVERLRAPAGSEDPFSAEELAQAMMDTEKLLRRIAELDGAHADAVRWAERVSGELREAHEAIAARDAQLAKCDTLVLERDGEIARKEAQLEEIWHSPSWRLTQPLRTGKTLLAQRRRGSGS